MAAQIQPRPLSEAINAYNQTHGHKIKRYNTIQDLKIAGFGTRIFASYDKKKGWEFTRIGCVFCSWIVRIIRCSRTLSKLFGYQNTLLSKARKQELVAALTHQAAHSTLNAKSQAANDPNVLVSNPPEETVKANHSNGQAKTPDVEDPSTPLQSEDLLEINLRNIKLLASMKNGEAIPSWVDASTLDKMASFEEEIVTLGESIYKLVQAQNHLDSLQTRLCDRRNQFRSIRDEHLEEDDINCRFEIIQYFLPDLEKFKKIHSQIQTTQLVVTKLQSRVSNLIHRNPVVEDDVTLVEEEEKNDEEINDSNPAASTPTSRTRRTMRTENFSKEEIENLERTIKSFSEILLNLSAVHENMLEHLSEVTHLTCQPLDQTQDPEGYKKSLITLVRDFLNVPNYFHLALANTNTQETIDSVFKQANDFIENADNKRYLEIIKKMP